MRKGEGEGRGSEKGGGEREGGMRKGEGRGGRKKVILFKSVGTSSLKASTSPA